LLSDPPKAHNSPIIEGGAIDRSGLRQLLYSITFGDQWHLFILSEKGLISEEGVLENP
jgi:hypothetical protein